MRYFHSFLLIRMFYQADIPETPCSVSNIFLGNGETELQNLTIPCCSCFFLFYFILFLFFLFFFVCFFFFFCCCCCFFFAFLVQIHAMLSLTPIYIFFFFFFLSFWKENNHANFSFLKTKEQLLISRNKYQFRSVLAELFNLWQSADCLIFSFILHNVWYILIFSGMSSYFSEAIFCIFTTFFRRVSFKRSSFLHPSSVQTVNH